MRVHRLAGSFWPTERQKLLLRAALHGGAEGLEAWRRLRPALDLDALETESSVLLPLVQRQLAAAGVEDPLLPTLRGMHRRTWYVNQLRLDRLTPALQAVEESDAHPLVVSSFELPAHYYGDFGVRAVAALHLVVRPDDFSRATQALADGGWASVRHARDWSSFADAEGEECVVNRWLFPEFPAGVDPAELWESTVSFDLNGVSARGLGAADELLNVCLSGARMGRWASLVWIADAFAVVRAAGTELDWPRLIERATRLRATLRLRDALIFLRAELGASVPEGVAEELERVPVNRREVLAHRIAAARWALIGPAPESLTRFLRVTADRNVLPAIVALPSYLRDEWSLDRRSQVPLAAARKVAARVGSVRRVRARERLRRNQSQNVVE
jgi:hypothetical protein